MCIFKLHKTLTSLPLIQDLTGPTKRDGTNWLNGPTMKEVFLQSWGQIKEFSGHIFCQGISLPPFSGSRQKKHHRGYRTSWISVVPGCWLAWVQFFSPADNQPQSLRGLEKKKNKLTHPTASHLHLLCGSTIPAWQPRCVPAESQDLGSSEAASSPTQLWHSPLCYWAQAGAGSIPLSLEWKINQPSVPPKKTKRENILGNVILFQFSNVVAEDIF